MERRSYQLLWFLLAVLVFLSHSSALYAAENFTNTRIISFTGHPVVIPANRTEIPVSGQIQILSNTRIVTGSNDSVLIQFSGNRNCQFVLGPNSVMEFLGAKTPLDYRAYLQRGVFSYQAVPCQITLDVETSMGRLRGQNSKFSVRVGEDTTTVFVRSGDLRLFIRGESIPLREMTQTTISHSGSHRIASIEDPTPGIGLLSPPMAFQNNDIPSQNISPVSATKRP